MRLALVLLLVAHTARAETGALEEAAIGTSQARGLLAKDDGGMAVHGHFGWRRGHLGCELLFQGAELGRDDTGNYSALSIGPMFTARHMFARTQMDPIFARWFEVYGRIGPTFTWVHGDPGDGPMDGATGFGLAAGGGIRFVFGAISLVADVTVVKTRASSAGSHDPADELGIRDEPGADVNGHIITKTFGIGFSL